MSGSNGIMIFASLVGVVCLFFPTSTVAPHPPPPELSVTLSANRYDLSRFNPLEMTCAVTFSTALHDLLPIVLHNGMHDKRWESPSYVSTSSVKSSGNTVTTTYSFKIKYAEEGDSGIYTFKMYGYYRSGNDRPALVRASSVKVSVTTAKPKTCFQQKECLQLAFPGPEMSYSEVQEYIRHVKRVFGNHLYITLPERTACLINYLGERQFKSVWLEEHNRVMTNNGKNNVILQVHASCSKACSTEAAIWVPLPTLPNAVNARDACQFYHLRLPQHADLSCVNGLLEGMGSEEGSRDVWFRRGDGHVVRSDGRGFPWHTHMGPVVCMGPKQGVGTDIIVRNFSITGTTGVNLVHTVISSNPGIH